MRKGTHSLRARVVLAIVGTVLATSLIFGLAAFTIAYTMEDRLFRRALVDEIAHQKSSWVKTGSLATPKNPDIAILIGKQALPPDIQKEFAENPGQSEFYGRQGRHYHILRFELPASRPAALPTPAVSVIEVSGDLLVRPYRDSIIQFLALMSLFIATFMAIFAWWLVNRAMKPLSTLAKDVAHAEPAIPIIDATTYPANEIGMLAEALEQAFVRVRGFVAREQAFTRDASHELRTPLAVVCGAAEVIALNRDLPLHMIEPLRRIETATMDMGLALDQLLALARENNGVPKETVALRPVINKAVSWSKSRYPDSVIKVSIAVDSSATAFVHPISLQLVLNNLIGNCFQHVRTGGLVINFDGGSMTISDDGPGFELEAITFAPFAKGDASIGSGLGLDISRRLCDAAGIGLTVGKGDRGRGTKLHLEF